MAETKIQGCTCIHKYQDKKYGLFKRLHNVKVDKKTVCTVCRKEKGL